jgi:predicted DNA-binding transcriptional regulator YafY
LIRLNTSLQRNGLTGSDPACTGSIFFEATVNSLNEIAGWIISRGEGVKVLAPDILKEHVMELAQGVLKNY